MLECRRQLFMVDLNESAADRRSRGELARTIGKLVAARRHVSGIAVTPLTAGRQIDAGVMR